MMATPTKRAMAAATRAAGDEEGNGEGKGGESDGDVIFTASRFVVWLMLVDS